MSYNPYGQAPTSQQQPRHNLAAAKSKVLLPGIALIVVGSLGLLIMGAYALLNIYLLSTGELDLAPPPEMQGPEAPWFMVGAYASMAVIFLNPLFQILVILGGVAMVRAKGKGLAVTGAVLSIIPCFGSSVCFLGIPFGIWAVVVLADPNVKRLFK